jgi:hypothetical protein
MKWETCEKFYTQEVEGMGEKDITEKMLAD